MTLRELMQIHPGRFYPQTWYEHEAFMDAQIVYDLGIPAHSVATLQPLAPNAKVRYSAGLLAHLYLAHPDHPIWAHYIWTSDFDAIGQRVYVGQNGKGLEIHRHIHLTTRFVNPFPGYLDAPQR